MPDYIFLQLSLERGLQEKAEKNWRHRKLTIQKLALLKWTGLMEINSSQPEESFDYDRLKTLLLMLLKKTPKLLKWRLNRNTKLLSFNHIGRSSSILSKNISQKVS